MIGLTGALLTFLAQPGATPPCTPPVPSGICQSWMLESRAFDVPIKTWTSKIEEKKRIGGWCSSPACYCAYYEAGTRPHNCHEIQCSYSQANSVCYEVGVGGSISQGGQIGINLAFALLGELNTTWAFNGTLSHCVEFSVGLTFSPRLSDCWNHMARDEWIEATIYGWVDFALTVDYWECVHPNGMVYTVSTHCGVHTAAGDAMHVRSRGIFNAPYPCPVEPVPPGYAGPYAVPCCTSPASPAPCDTALQPGQTPCCGTWGGQ